MHNNFSDKEKKKMKSRQAREKNVGQKRRQQSDESDEIESPDPKRLRQAGNGSSLQEQMRMPLYREDYDDAHGASCSTETVKII